MHEKQEQDCLPMLATWAVRGINGPWKLESWGDCGSELRYIDKHSVREIFITSTNTGPFLLIEQALNFPQLLIWHLSWISVFTLENKKAKGQKNPSVKGERKSTEEITVAFDTVAPFSWVQRGEDIWEFVALTVSF